MKILLAVEDLRIGGAQVFALRLAQALSECGHEVRIFNHYANYVDADLVKRIAPSVPVESFGSVSIGPDWLLRKSEGLMRRFGQQWALRVPFVAQRMKRLIQDFQPDVVNSHTIHADYAAAVALRGQNKVPLVITMHGCYELFLHKIDGQETTRQGKEALIAADEVVYLTDKNLEIYADKEVASYKAKAVKIYNGFDAKFSAEKAACTRESLNIPADALVFGMVARGIAQKGWQAAINSFNKVAAEYANVHLVLVGDSEYLNELKQHYESSHIHFTGFSRNPIDWIDLFDVGLLPSFFHAESLPNSIAEYLACGKPVIASRIGEVPAMIASDKGDAGIIIDQYNFEGVDEGQLVQAMSSYLTDPMQLVVHSERAASAYEKFRMSHCVAEYVKTFNRAIGHVANG